MNETSGNEKVKGIVRFYIGGISHSAITSINRFLIPTKTKKYGLDLPSM
jgi:hypothetical protein